MAAGDAIFVGIQIGILYQQGDAQFTENQWGFDDGLRRFLTHPKTPKNQWPQRNAADNEYPQMYVSDVIPRYDESGLVELTVLYRGIMRFASQTEPQKQRKLPGSDVAMMTLAALSSGNKARISANIPMPSAGREYVTLTKPTLQGVSLTVNETWLPDKLPGFSIQYIPDPDEPLTLNYSIGWKLDSRTWQDVADKVWLVREEARYYYPMTV